MVTIICGKCETEWSGDATSSRTCPRCGNDGEIESHVVRIDKRASQSSPGYASAETAYGRTVGYGFAIKVF